MNSVPRNLPNPPVCKTTSHRAPQFGLPLGLGLPLCAALSLALACGQKEEPKPSAANDLIVSDAAPTTPEVTKGPNARKLLAKAQAELAPLPAASKSPTNPITPEKIELGRMLFHETRMSKDNDIACSTCHALSDYGVDGKKTSTGHKGQQGDRNAPTVYNAGFHLAQFWDGRAADLEEQAKGPILNPIEHGMADEASVVAALAAVPGYVAAFEKAFPGEAISYDNMAKAIGAFERKLVTPSRFDTFVAGDMTALSDQELAGLDLFMSAQCITCHTGVAVGGTMYQKLGNVKAWPTYKDEGRMAHTKAEADKYFFKVPSLRNITKTGPYMHDGSVESLEEMVKMMTEYQTNKGKLSPQEMKDMLAFLEALTGELPTEYIKSPTLPPDAAG